MARVSEREQGARARGRRGVAWLRRGGRRLADLWPLTPLGMAACAGAAYALREFAYAELDLVLLVLGWAAVGVASLSLVSVIAATVYLRLRTRRLPRLEFTMETGRWSPSGLALPALRWVPLVAARLEWVAPSSVAARAQLRRGKLEEELWATRRGRLGALERRLVVADAFGLSRLAIRLRQEADIEVLPHKGALERMPLLSSFAGGDERPHPMGVADGDRVELRKYVPGDPARFIHWKVFGRTRKLVVRVPERALTLSRRTVAYLVAGEDDGAAAAAARVAVDVGALGEEWVFGADGSPGRTSERDEALSRIVRSSAEDVVGGAGLARYVAEAEREGPATLVLFAPPKAGPWLAEVSAVLRARRGRARVVLGVDTIRRPLRPPLWRRLLVRPRASRGADEAELSTVRRALTQDGAEVLVVDRVTGRLLGRPGLNTRALGAMERAA